MPPHLQIRQRTSRAIRIRRRQLHPASQSSATARALLIPLLHHRQTYSTHTTMDPTLVDTRGIAVDRAFLAPPNQRHLDVRSILEVSLTHLHSVTIAITATSSGLCHPVSAATKRTMAWLLPSSFSPAVLGALAHREAFRLLSLRMPLLFPIFPLSTWTRAPSPAVP